MKKYEFTQYELVKVRVDHKPLGTSKSESEWELANLNLNLNGDTS